MDDDNVQNKMYFPNVCAYCQRFGEDVQLIKCDKCMMVSYCSRQHQERDFPLHSDLCKAIQETFEGNQLQVLKDINDMSRTDWMHAIIKTIRKVKFNLGRPLQLYEVLILMYDRTCTVCGKQFREMTNCPNCPIVSFCLEHKNSPVHEKKMCEQMAKYLNINRAFETNYSDIGHYLEAVRHSYPDDTHSMQDFLAFYESIRQEHNTSLDILSALHSYCLTQALTVFHGLRMLSYISKDGTLVIHIINQTNVPTKQILWGWECLLHLLTNVTAVKIVYLGTFNQLKTCESLPVCARCETKNKTLTYYTYPLIHITCTAQYEKPDIFVMYNVISCPAVNNFDILLRFLFKQQRPCIFTFYNLKEIESNINTVQITLNKKVWPMYVEENPFGSINPLLSYNTKTIELDNTYLCIYKTLFCAA